MTVVISDCGLDRIKPRTMAAGVLLSTCSLSMRSTIYDSLHKCRGNGHERAVIRQYNLRKLFDKLIKPCLKFKLVQYCVRSFNKDCVQSVCTLIIINKSSCLCSCKRNHKVRIVRLKVYYSLNSEDKLCLLTVSVSFDEERETPSYAVELYTSLTRTRRPVHSSSKLWIGSRC